jgi:hypothetical protein
MKSPSDCGYEEKSISSGLGSGIVCAMLGIVDVLELELELSSEADSMPGGPKGDV